MNKKQQLYIKNEKGRYEPYKPKEIGDKNVYRKIGNKYVPFAVCLNRDEDWLQSGVFVVRSDKEHGMRSWADSEYLQECFHIDKVSDNYRITAEQLASLQDYTDYCYNELKKFENERREKGIGISYEEKMQVVVGSVFKFSAILKERMEKEHTQKRSPLDSERPFF